MFQLVIITLKSRYLDVGKLKTVPIDLKNIYDVAKNEVVKK